mmetsp:Transcript_23067/g.74335  ORF Transcript_23067/g.74335 Transcript_23067/m.74335 type:complete len:326 (+) Transcript_23067:98-1075(+)
MGVWACSCGTLRFGARLSQEVLDTLVKKLAADENRYLERQDEGMFQHAFVLGGSDDEEDDGAVSLEDLNNRLDFWLKMHRVQRSLLVMSAGVGDPRSPLRLLDGKPELLKMVFHSLMPVKAPTLKSLVEKAAAAVKKEATAEPAQAGEVEDAPAEDAPEEALTLCVRGFGAEPVDAADLPSWRHQRELHAQLCSLYRKRYPLELEIDFVTKFEGYGQDFPFYILGVAGEQDAPHFSGEKKLGMWDNDDGSSGVDFCAPIGTFSAPEGGAEKITTAIDALRAGGMLPAEPTAAEMAEMNAKGLIIMPNIPYVAEVGWNVVGHSHVG